MKLHVAGIDSALDLHNPLPCSQAIQIDLLALFQKQRLLGCENILLMLQPQVNLGVAVAQDINGKHGRMLSNTDQPFTEAADLPENIFETVGGLFLVEAFRKEIVDFFQENDVPQGIGFSLPQPVEVNPSQHNFTEEHPQRLGQFLIQFDDNRFFQQFLQVDRIPGIERASG